MIKTKILVTSAVLSLFAVVTPLTAFGDHDPSCEPFCLHEFTITLYSDLNNDGIRDVNEPGIEGVLLNLIDETGNIIASQSTDIDGVYPVDGGLLSGFEHGVVITEIPEGFETSENCMLTTMFTPTAENTTVDICLVPINTATPSEATQQLIELIKEQNFPNNVEKSLLGSLKQVSKILDDDNPDNDSAACDKLDDFINNVNSKESSGKISATDADELRDAAISIQGSLGC